MLLISQQVVVQSNCLVKIYIFLNYGVAFLVTIQIFVSKL